MKHYGYIYKIVCKINGKIYIGQTTGSLKTRLRCHYYDSKKAHLSTKIGCAFRKYGRENFSIFVICKANSRTELDNREIMCIRIFNSIKKGYNIRIGGKGSEHSQESKNRMSISRKGKPKPKGFGDKISKALKGRKQSESHRINNKQAQIDCQAHHDHKHSEETKKKMSLSGKGKQKPEGFGEGVAERNRQRVVSDLTKEKMSNSRKGKPTHNKGKLSTEKTKNNISNGLKKSTKVFRQKIYCEANNKIYTGYKEASEDLKISYGSISAFFYGRTKTAQGFIFKKIT